MPAHQKKTTTSTRPEATSTINSAEPLTPENFHQYLRAEIRHATRAVMEELMREELSHFLQAEWGESTTERKGYRNGFYTRDLMTTCGPIEDLNVPRDREGVFHTQTFERYRRYEPQVAEGLTQMFVAGTSTHKVGDVAQTLMAVAPSARAVSRLNQTLTQQFEAWRQRPLQTHWRVVYLDGIHLKIRHGEKCDTSIILTALGVDLEGKKEVLALRVCAVQDKAGWLSLLQDMRTPGATQVDLLVTDGHDGLLAAVEDEEHLLTFYAFPSARHRHIQTTNAIEGFFSNVRQRTDQIDTFTTEMSCLTIVWAVMQDIRFHKIAVS